MNELIAKLYDQAIVIEDGKDYVCGELDPAKFAELIIRECVDCLESLGQTSRVEARDTIQEHFGLY